MRVEEEKRGEERYKEENSVEKRRHIKRGNKGRSKTEEEKGKK